MLVKKIRNIHNKTFYEKQSMFKNKGIPTFISLVKCFLVSEESKAKNISKARLGFTWMQSKYKILVKFMDKLKMLK